MITNKFFAQSTTAYPFSVSTNQLNNFYDATIIALIASADIAQNPIRIAAM